MRRTEEATAQPEDRTRRGSGRLRQLLDQIRPAGSTRTESALTTLARDLAGVGTEERRLVTDASFAPALALLEHLLDLVPDDGTRAAVAEEAARHVRTLGSYVAWDATPPRGMTEARHDVEKRIWAAYSGKGLWRLELGSYTAFPDEYVARIVDTWGLGNFIRLDLDPTHGPDLIADCTKLPLADGSVDVVTSNSLFEHVARPDLILGETFRCLAPGGYTEVTTPFHFPTHGCPRDYLRVAPHYFEDVCREIGFESVHVHTYDYGGVYYTLHNLLKAATLAPKRPELAPFVEALQHNLLVLLALAMPSDPHFWDEGRQLFQAVRAQAFKAGTLAPRPRPESWDATRAASLSRLLPALRCVRTGQPLTLQGDVLRSLDGTETYPLVHGTPRVV